MRGFGATCVPTVGYAPLTYGYSHLATAWLFCCKVKIFHAFAMILLRKNLLRMRRILYLWRINQIDWCRTVVFSQLNLAIFTLKEKQVQRLLFYTPELYSVV